MARNNRPARAARTDEEPSPSPGAPASTSAAPLSPDPTQPIPAVFLKSPTRSTFVYRKRIERVDRNARPGDWVAVYGRDDDELLGYGLYNPRSEIVVRILSWGSELPADGFWHSRLSRAVSLRRELLRLDAVTDSYRVVHAEADGLSGLVIDKLGDVLSAEVFSLGMYQRARSILDLLQPMLGTRHAIVRAAPQTHLQEGFLPEPYTSPGAPERITITEHGTRFRVQFAGGHKTGFFCDQRDNRKQLAEFCHGRRVLDLCCYTGGFAVQAKRLGEAAEVTAVDLDAEPLAVGRENAALNQVRVQFVQADVFAYMRDMLRGGKRYGVVILDPPKLIRSRAELEEGTAKHYDLNRLAIQLVEPGGLLLTCTCSGLLGEAEFNQLIYAAARNAVPREGEAPPGTPIGDSADTSVGMFGAKGRAIQVIGRTGAAACHPVAPSCPETEYLKAVWLRVL